MNNFYASVECMLDPVLKKYPVAVCGSVEERHGIVLAKNYAAKAFGIKTGDAVWQAKQKCRNLVVVPPHFEEYIKYSKLARNVYQRYTDQVEPYGMDECWLDISGTDYAFGSPEKVANDIISNSQAEEQKSSAFSFSQEIIDAVLTRGSGISEGKMRIYEQFEKSLSAKENADFLKNEYGWGGSYPVIVGAGMVQRPRTMGRP